jgi:hypothetical protein
MIKEERTKHLLEKWSKVLDYTNVSCISGEKIERKLTTAMLIEPQEIWKNPECTLNDTIKENELSISKKSYSQI